MTSPDIPQIDLTHLASGKVRETYELDADHLVFVTTDRISAYDVVLTEEIPNKGRVLNGMTAFWMDELSEIVPTQVPETPPDLPDVFEHPYFLGRTAVVRKAEMLPAECIVRSHLTGSAWSEYKETGTVHGMAAPAGMRESERFPEHIFTPSTKAERGQHDQNISFDQLVELVGGETAEYLRAVCLSLFTHMYKLAEARGVILADTKAELGRLVGTGTIILGDEVGTPDSSRLWTPELVVVGETPPSFDKQYVRDFLTATGWDKKTLPPPTLPRDVIATTTRKYIEAYERITKLYFANLPGVEI